MIRITIMIKMIEMIMIVIIILITVRMITMIVSIIIMIIMIITIITIMIIDGELNYVYGFIIFKHKYNIEILFSHREGVID